MSCNYFNLFQRLTGRTITSTAIYMLLSTQALAVQPMSESDLEVVSATTGSNILNIFGASQAGLKIDDSGSETTAKNSVNLKTESFNEGESTKPIAINTLRAIDDIKPQTSYNNDLAISNTTQTTVLRINEQTKGNASLFSTNSEINYKTNNVHHNMREIDNGGVAVSRDLLIDLLKIENLRGNNTDESRSAGSVYLSDWRSQGDTRINISK